MLKWAWALFLHTVKWFQVLLHKSQFNISHLLAHSLFYLTHREDPIRCYHSGNDGNEEVLLIPQISKAEASPSDGLMLNPGHSLKGGVGLLLLFKGTVSVFYSPSQLGLNLVGSTIYP